MTAMVESPKKQKNKALESQPEIRRGRLSQLFIYEISESELEALAQGSPNSVYLVFAVFLLSVSVSFFIALLTTAISSNRTFIVFVIIAVVGAIGGAVLLSLWFNNHKSIPKLVQTIKARLPVQEQTMQGEPEVKNG